MHNQKKPYIFVLSVDGGGVRGIIPAIILSEIERRTNLPISTLFDAVSGTSTGGLITLAITAPDANRNPQYKATEIVDIYLQYSKEIFFSSYWRKIYTGFGLWGSKYSNTAYARLLNSIFGSSLLSKTLCPAFIPIYLVGKQTPFIANTISAQNAPENDFYLRDIAEATSAAMTYFPVKKFHDIAKKVNYYGADGSIYAKNPELIAVASIYSLVPNFNLMDITVVSIGTGTFHERNPLIRNQGEIGWLKNASIIYDMLNAESLIAESAIKALLGKDNHFRFEVKLPIKLSAIDDTSSTNIKELLSLTKKYIKDNSAQIDELCRILTA